jgi:hypothetical protein
MSAVLTSVESRLLQLLGNGVPATQAAAALGLTDGRVSQILSDEQFAEKVATERFNNLQKHNARDSEYDEMEDTLLKQLKAASQMAIKPLEIAKLLQIVNQAKRRGQAAPENILNKQAIVQLVIPVQIIQRYTANIDNQVVKAGDQDLLTIQSGNMNTLAQRLKERADQKLLEGGQSEQYVNAKISSETVNAPAVR